MKVAPTGLRNAGMHYVHVSFNRAWNLQFNLDRPNSNQFKLRSAVKGAAQSTDQSFSAQQAPSPHEDRIFTQQHLVVCDIVDYYELLGVHDDVQDDELKQAWRALSKSVHPDLLGDECQDVAAIVNQAYETLKDKDRRKLYNQELQAALNYAYETYDEKPLSKWIPEIWPHRSTATDEVMMSQGLYVDESRCIGCRQCVHIAPATFRIEPVYLRARVYAQWIEPLDQVEGARLSCPTECIKWRPVDELASLEYVVQRSSMSTNRVPVNLMLIDSDSLPQWYVEEVAATVRARKRQQREELNKHKDEFTATAMRRKAAEVLQQRKLTWLEIAMSDAAAEAIKIEGGSKFQAQAYEPPKVGRRRRAMTWREVVSATYRKYHIGTPARIIPQEMFGSPFKTSRPHGEIIPRELALVPMSNSDAQNVA